VNSFLIRLLAVCFFLTVLCPIIGAAADDTSTTSVANIVEIRGPVYDGADISEILSNTAYGDVNTIIMDANNFATFY
jgi:hypothetical protein